MLCVYSVYFIMKYTKKEKFRYALIASILTSVAYALRMNNLIYFIAICIYLFLDILNTKKIRKIILKILVILLFATISILPCEIAKKKAMEKLNVSDTSALPAVGYIYMGIQGGGFRGDGWYNTTYANIGLKYGDESIETYKYLIKKRVNELLDKPFEMLKFFIRKNASMWAENTYSAILFNHSYYSSKYNSKYKIEKTQSEIEKIDKLLLDNEQLLNMLQKGVIFVIFLSTLAVLLKFRKNISNDVLLLVLIFIGGFLFHTFWEAKSRYIIIYIIMLMPLTAIEIPIKNLDLTNEIKENSFEKMELKKMKLKKKLFKRLVAIFIILIVSVIAICVLKKNNKEKNICDYDKKITETFENIKSWEIYDYELEANKTKNTVVTISGDTKKDSDNKTLYIESKVLNDVRAYRNIIVEPNSYYKLTVSLNGETTGGEGINISAIGCKETISLETTEGIWYSYNIYLKTGENQKNIKFSLGIGGYSNLSKGYAYFDDFSLERLKEVSSEYYINTFTEEKEEKKEETLNANDEQLIRKLIFLGIVVFILITSILVMKKKTKVEYEKNKLNKYDYITLILLTIVTAIFSFYKLGNHNGPSSFWKPAEAGEYITIEFDDIVDVHAIAHNGNVPNSNGYYKICYSQDGINYSYMTLGDAQKDQDTRFKKSKSYFFRWKIDKNINLKCKYIKVEVAKPGWGINELAFLRYNLTKKDYEVLNFKIIDTKCSENSIGTPEMLFDEQDTVEFNRTYMNGTYFDECYFVRTAYEQLHGWKLYERVQPPFGKILISIGILIFGMNPFGWRFMGTLFGVLLVPLMYLFGRKIFKKRKYAFISAFLLMFDFMRFSHTRLGTVDSFSTFFVLLMYYFMFDYVMNEKDRIIKNKESEAKYYPETKEEKKRFKKLLRSLLFCGIAFGLGAATKWSCIYAAFGLSGIFFVTKFFEFWQIRKEKDIRKKWFTKNFVPTCLWCVLFFVIIPLTIYVLSYIVCMPQYPDQSLLKIVIDNQIHIFTYHKNLVSTHTYASRWWTWSLNKRPLLVFKNANLGNNMTSTISSFGNPAVWWASSIGIFISAILILKNKEKKAWVLLVAYIFQMIPWIIITRTEYIYSYFIPIPFAILLLTYCFEKIKINKTLKNILIIVYLALVLMLFIKFFPVISGIPVDKNIVKELKWFKTWNF